ncbi:MAG: GNAT family N-acetyltransferase [Christensenellales bacterium]
MKNFTTEILPEKFSSSFTVRRLNKADVKDIYSLCASNPAYYKHINDDVSTEKILRDLKRLPSGKKKSDKFFVGYFKDEMLVAVLDLIIGWPDERTAHIGLFMVRKNFQNIGAGRTIINELCRYLKDKYPVLRLGYAKSNDESKKFWLKNGFSATGEEKTVGSFTAVIMIKQL